MSWPCSVFPLASLSWPLARSTAPSRLAVSWLAGQDHETGQVMRFVWSSLQSAEWVKKSLSEVRHVLPIELYMLWEDISDGVCFMNSGMFGWFRTMMVGALVDGSRPRTEPLPLLLHCALVTIDLWLVLCVTLVRLSRSGRCLLRFF